ncbi:MAG: protein TolR [Alphaproteobacteria bacterium]|nr:protein TolR [Alphaproteobacteria bacterium]
MGAQLATGPSRFQRRGAGAYSRKPMSDINVTPFVDVMLVLLVVFMVTAPLLAVGVPVDLPRTAAQRLAGQDEPLAVSVDAQGLVWVQERQVELAQLGPLLKEISGQNPDIRIFVRGDQAIHYGRVLEVMSGIQAAGFTKVALVARSPGTEPARR